MRGGAEPVVFDGDVVDAGLLHAPERAVRIGEPPVNELGVAGGERAKAHRAVGSEDFVTFGIEHY